MTHTTITVHSNKYSFDLRMDIFYNSSLSRVSSKCYTGPHPQIEAWVGHCACVVETGLATQHWSGKLEGCAQHGQHAQHATTSSLEACPQKKSQITHSEIESEGIFKNMCRGNSYINCTHTYILYLFIYIIHFNQRYNQVTFIDLNDPVTHWAKTQCIIKVVYLDIGRSTKEYWPLIFLDTYMPLFS